jgi:hypothetical protein
MVGVLPARLALLWARLEPFGIVFVLLLVASRGVLRQAGIAFDPLGAMLMPALDASFQGVLWLAGVRHDVGL